MIEDITTTGGSAVEAIEALREAGAVVERLLVVVDREEGARSTVEARDVSFEPLLVASDLLST